MTRVLRLVCPILSLGILASGYFLGGWNWLASGVLIIGLLWLLGLILNWAWISHFVLVAAFFAAGGGLLLGLSPGLFIPGAVFALLAWDLAGFRDRLSLASPDDDIITLEKRHLIRVAALALCGLVLSGFSLSLHFKSPFEWMIILLFFTVWAIGKVVGLLIKRGQ